MDRVKFKCPSCGQTLTFSDILHEETIDKIKNTYCPAVKHLSAKKKSRDRFRAMLQSELVLFSVSKVTIRDSAEKGYANAKLVNGCR
ncbi:hypothetical protein [Klebsiella quasipneumoniae]|uniref:hypothetical protein n=1 Tax=Klebsiella quasipneumoniae TaxID=1463165 RepID=UPI00188D24E2|nr:hypothetical protein [Klebsiella quasipneumoniae]